MLGPKPSTQDTTVSNLWLQDAYSFMKKIKTSEPSKQAIRISYLIKWWQVSAMYWMPWKLKERNSVQTQELRKVSWNLVLGILNMGSCCISKWRCPPSRGTKKSLDRDLGVTTPYSNNYDSKSEHLGWVCRMRRKPRTRPWETSLLSIWEMDRGRSSQNRKEMRMLYARNQVSSKM